MKKGDVVAFRVHVPTLKVGIVRAIDHLGVHLESGCDMHIVPLSDVVNVATECAPMVHLPSAKRTVASSENVLLRKQLAQARALLRKLKAAGGGAAL